MKGSDIDVCQNHTLRENCPYSEFYWSECGKIRTRKTLNTQTFHAVLNTPLRIMENLLRTRKFFIKQIKITLGMKQIEKVCFYAFPSRIMGLKPP